MTDPEINALLWKVGIFSAAVAALVGGMFQFLNGWRERVAEKHRQTRELAAKLALKYWKRRMEVEDARKAGQELTIKRSRANFLRLLLRRLSLQKRRAQASAQSAAFELAKYG